MTLVKIDANVDRTFARMNAATEGMELFESFTAPRATVAERMQAGKALRTKVPRTSHAEFEKAANLRDEIGRLRAQNEKKAS